MAVSASPEERGSEELRQGVTHELVDEQAQDVALLLRLVSQQIRKVHDRLRTGMRERVDRHLLRAGKK